MEHYFEEISDSEMKYTKIGLFVVEHIEKTAQIRENEIEIPVFVVMTNHIHLIIFIDEPRRDAPSASTENVGRNTSITTKKTHSTSKETHSMRLYGGGNQK